MVDTEGNYRFKRLAPRLPKTLREWHVNREGKLVALVQYAPVRRRTTRHRGRTHAHVLGGRGSATTRPKASATST